MATEGSSVVVLSERGEVLLGLRADARIWALPAGRREPGESYEETAIREVREETGYEVTLQRLVGEYWRPQMPHGGDRMRVYVGRVVGGNPLERDRENVAVRWWPLDALPRRLFTFSREHIEDARAGAAEPFRKEQRLTGLGAALLRCFVVCRTARNRIRAILLRRTGA